MTKRHVVAFCAALACALLLAACGDDSGGGGAGGGDRSPRSTCSTHSAMPSGRTRSSPRRPRRARSSSAGTCRCGGRAATTRTGSGGLGYALPAAVGLKMASPDRPVVCVIGDGSTMFAIQALWTAPQHQIPVAVVVVNNQQYKILKSFRDMLGAGDAIPGLDLPGIDIVT